MRWSHDTRGTGYVWMAGVIPTATATLNCRARCRILAVCWGWQRITRLPLLLRRVVTSALAGLQPWITLSASAVASLNGAEKIFSITAFAAFTIIFSLPIYLSSFPPGFPPLSTISILYRRQLPIGLHVRRRPSRRPRSSTPASALVTGGRAPPHRRTPPPRSQARWPLSSAPIAGRWVPLRPPPRAARSQPALFFFEGHSPPI